MLGLDGFVVRVYFFRLVLPGFQGHRIRIIGAISRRRHANVVCIEYLGGTQPQQRIEVTKGPVGQAIGLVFEGFVPYAQFASRRNGLGAAQVVEEAGGGGVVSGRRVGTDGLLSIWFAADGVVVGAHGWI